MHFSKLKICLLLAIVSIHIKSYEAVSRIELLRRLKRLQEDVAYDDRYNEISRDPLDNVLFFVSDDSRQEVPAIPTRKTTTSTTTTTTTTTVAPSTTSGSSDEQRYFFDPDFREGAARIALSSRMTNFMRNLMNTIFG